MSTTPIRPFTATAAQADLDDLRGALQRTRFAATVPGDAWTSAPPRRTCRTWWRAGWSSDWRAVEERINAYPNFITEIDGQTIHFIHVRSGEPDATPLLLAHTYPGSFVEFLDLVGPLTDPVAHGGRAEDAFDLVIPSMPGFGFSTPLDTAAGRWPGWPGPTTR